jgi:hypothetical protein
MIHGLYVMSGTKFSLSLASWREKIGGGYTTGPGGIIDFYVGMTILTIICAGILIVVAPLLVQKLSVLLLGNTAVCLLLYYKFKDKKTLP